MASFMKEFEHLKVKLQDIKNATNSFRNEIIGKGGFGSVYKGEVSHTKGRNIVAIKRLDRKFGQGDPEFLKEIMMLSRYTHQNLVSFLGYCDEDSEKILVYEYACNGSLDQHLSDPGLSWTQRLKICIGAAKALTFLHVPNGTYRRVLHCDIKSANILLDECLNAKVADFGLARFGPANQQYSYLFTNARGTPGYCDPLYMMTYTLTKESDVYSFGVVLFEVLCGRLCFQVNRGQLMVFVPMWKQSYSDKKLQEIIFQDVMHQMDPTSLEIFSDVAFQCLQHAREERPTMSFVVKKLELALESQVLADSNPSQSEISEKLQFAAMVDDMRMAYSENKTYIENVANDLSEDDLDISSLQVIMNEDLEELKELGSGQFGTVYHGKWRGTDVAIKRIKKACFADQSSEQEAVTLDFWREASILSKLHHPNLVAFYGIVKDGPSGTLSTVTEFMVNGSLRHVLLQKDRYLDHRKKLIIAMDAAIGMDYLHSKKIVHFDLKCDNLLVNIKDPSRPICKVSDFGLSKIKRNNLVSGGVRGTLPWMAPELLNGSSSKVSEKVDVFSFGIVLWEILTGEEPYANMHYRAIIGGIVRNTLRPTIPCNCDGEWRKLMERCWAPNPIVRPSFAEITRELRVMSVASRGIGHGHNAEKTVGHPIQT